MNKRSLIFILFILLASLALAQNLLSGQNAKVIQGATNYSYGVYLNNDHSISGFQLEVSYPSYLAYKGITNNNLTITINSSITGLLNIAALSESGISPGQNKIFDIVFDVQQAALPGNYSINFSNTIFADINTTIIPLNITNGILEIVQPYNITFLPPISTQDVFTLQSVATLPLKFNVSSNGSFITDNSVLVRVYNQSLGIDKTYNASGTGDEHIRINSTEQQYLVNIHTGNLNMSEGFYGIEVNFSNYQKTEIMFELVNKVLGLGRGHNS